MGVEHYLNLHQKIQVTVWDDDTASSDDTGISFDSYIKEMDGNRLLIHPPAPDEVRLYALLKKDIQIAITVEEPDRDPVIFYPRVIAQQTTGLVGYWLLVGEDLAQEVVKRRNFVRVPILMDVQVQSMAPEAPSDWLPAKTVDLSAGGIKFSCRRPFQMGELVRIRLPLLPNRPSIEVAGQVVYQLDEPAVSGFSGTYYHTALSFVGVSNELQNTIIGACFRHQMESRRRPGS